MIEARCPHLVRRLLAALALTAAASSPVSAQFVRGDVDASLLIDLSDSVSILQSLFVTAEPFACADAADVNDDGAVDIADGIYGLGFLFLGSPAPPEPFPECGADTTDDTLECEVFDACDTELECLTVETLEGLIAELPGLSFCLPAGLVDVSQGGFDVAVCPAAGASACGELEEPGCPIELSSFSPFLDAPGSTVGLRVDGRIEDLPIDITEGLFNTTTTCLTDVEGVDPGAPFVIDVFLPLVTAEIEPGVLEIVATGEPEVELVDVRIAASGGAVCDLFEALQGQFISQLVGPLEQNLGVLTEQVDELLVGQRLCP